MSQTAAHLVDHVIPHVPVRQWVLSLPIPLRVLLAAQPELVTPVLQVVQRVVTRHL
ncbi:MAG: IS91 family transposase, partial [Burkholderiaceae bacterium]